RYPDAMKLARIQCESCHGPGSAHYGIVDDSKMVSTLNSENCAWCHDRGSHHIYPYQWDISRHGDPLNASRGTRTSCGPCHSGAGFVAWVKGGKQDLTTAPPEMAITCATCHEPHSVENLHQVRTVDATLEDGTVITDGGLGLLCMNCHKSRDNAKTDTNVPGSHYGPHYAPQADVLAAANVVTFGKTLPTSPHIKGNACVECHMAETHETDPNLIAGAHSFRMINGAGADHVEACEKCHGSIGESFAEKKFYMNGNADHDGDGTEEGLQEEVHGLMEKLGALLPDADPHADPDSTWTLTELKAAYNHRVLYYDHSYGIHNPAFTVALLKVSIQALLNNAIEGEIVAIDDVPNDQGKQVRIIWNKFADDGIAIDPIKSYTVKRDDGDETWTGVGEHTADGSARYALVVPTLFDSTSEGNGMTSFKVVAISRSGMAYESVAGQGYSVDNLVPQAPTGLVALQIAGDVELTWEAPEDPDINFYRVYRSIEEDFVADETTEIGTTTDLVYTDKNLAIGDYYYKVAAIDFSGNLGEASAVVNATVTSVTGKDNTLPTEFTLSQNYPNPFNPITKIDFSVKKAGHVTLVVYNTLGQRVATLVEKEMSAGNYVVNFSGIGLSSGEYFYRIEVSDTDGVQFQSMRKMILMK
ncbi:MAG: cytochrome c3 family protein, partial [bacterium]